MFLKADFLLIAQSVAADGSAVTSIPIELQSGPGPHSGSGRGSPGEVRNDEPRCGISGLNRYCGA